jgi:hypothetical protein
VKLEGFETPNAVDGESILSINKKVVKEGEFDVMQLGDLYWDGTERKIEKWAVYYEGAPCVLVPMEDTSPERLENNAKGVIKEAIDFCLSDSGVGKLYEKYKKITQRSAGRQASAAQKRVSMYCC